MKIAPPTANETARLKALYDYDVLDTDAEKIFDELTQLAAQICDTPITLISLIDPDRQWFKSKVGLDAEETSRDIAFCAHAIHQQEIFEVRDTLLDSRFFDNPLVTAAPNIRFYAGTPLVTPEGHAIGTLCVIDNQPNQLTKQQRQALEVLGHSVISQMELRKSIKALKRANEHKTEFLSNMSHELRTPLNAIIGFSRLMLEESSTQQLPPKFVEHLGHIDYSGKRLLSVVNSVIDINKIEAGKMPVQLESTKIRELADNLHGMLTISANERDVDFSINVSNSVAETLCIDQAKISQIITNLVHNAIKFTDSGKWVQTELSVSKNNLLINVADQGAGISAQDQQKLFTKFQQVGQSKSAEGSGLGLSITKGLVQLLGGDIKLLSTLGKGSIFKVILPLSENVEKGSAVDNTKAETAHFDTRKKVLLVEDNEINQAVMIAIFSSIDTPISLAETGEQALDMTQKEDYDVIFMDIHLPGINGIEAAKMIKDKQPHLPIIALTADTYRQKDELYCGSLWEDFLSKPLEKERLIRVLNRLLPLTT